jgi:hypothetical protein
LRKYISDRGKIRGRKVSGNCQQHQRDVTDAIKTARELALLPYTQRTVTERRGGRGSRDDRGPRAPRPDRDGPSAPTSEVDSEAEVNDAGEAAEVFEAELVQEAAE